MADPISRAGGTPLTPIGSNGLTPLRRRSIAKRPARARAGARDVGGAAHVDFESGIPADPTSPFRARPENPNVDDITVSREGQRRISRRRQDGTIGPLPYENDTFRWQSHEPEKGYVRVVPGPNGTQVAHFLNVGPLGFYRSGDAAGVQGKTPAVAEVPPTAAPVKPRRSAGGAAAASPSKMPRLPTRLRSQLTTGGGSVR